jgi:hypothetical protein
LEKIKRGDIVGVRGRVGVNNNLINLICERLQPL